MKISIVILVVLVISLMTSKASIEIKDIHGKKIKIRFYIKLFNYIKIPIKFRIRKKIKLRTLKILQVLRENREKLKTEKFCVNLKFGADNAIFVAYSYAIISTIIPAILQDNKLPQKEKTEINIQPYFDKDILKVSINCIFSVKIVHIIYIIYVLRRRV